MKYILIEDHFESKIVEFDSLYIDTFSGYDDKIDKQRTVYRLCSGDNVIIHNDDGNLINELLKIIYINLSNNSCIINLKDLPVTVQFDTKYYKLENDQWKEYYEII